MKMNAMITGFQELQCELKAAENCAIYPAVNRRDKADALKYAACRYLMHDFAISEACVKESYRLRLKGKAGKRMFHTCVVPASCLELKGEDVKLKYAVSAEGVEVLEIRFQEKFRMQVEHTGMHQLRDWYRRKKCTRYAAA